MRMNLRAKIIAVIAFVVFFSFGFSTLIVLKFQDRRHAAVELMDVNILNDMIIRSTENAMLMGRSAEVQNIVGNIGKDPAILSLRILSPEGYILSSKKPEEIGKKAASVPRDQTGSISERPFVTENTVSSTAFIRNRPECFGCHDRNRKVNGIVDIKYDFSRRNADILAMKRFLVLSNVIAVIAVSLLLGLLFSRHIINPLTNFLKVIKKVEGGDLEARIEHKGKDELATFARSFNRMIEEIRNLYEKNTRREREISKARMGLEHKKKLEELNNQLAFKIKEAESANEAILSLSRELKNKNLELEKMVERLKRINEVGRMLSSIIETDALIKLIIRTTSELLKVEKSSIYLKKSNDARLNIEYNKGMGVENKSGVSIDFHPIYKELLADGTRTITRKTEDGMFAIGVPLKVKGQVIGGMLLEKLDSAFSEDELELLGTLANQAMVAIENAWLYESVKSNYFGTIQALVNALEANDKYTRGHSERVKFLSIELGKQLGLNYKELEALEHAAILHDIGKIGVDSMILNKPGKLTNSEFSLVKAHPLIGDEILGPIGTLEGVRTTIVQHHERYDGSGYPYGIAGEEISLKARILSVVDTFDAMMMDRPYRKALPLQRVKDELMQGSGTQFDPLVVVTFLDLLESREDDFLAKAGYFVN